jgi:ferritin-like metal-binding protein YciE
MQHPQVVSLLAGILLQEEQTAKVLEGLAPSLIQKAL